MKKEKYAEYIQNLQQALNHSLKFKNVHKIKFNQSSRLKTYITLNTGLR